MLESVRYLPGVRRNNLNSKADKRHEQVHHFKDKAPPNTSSLPFSVCSTNHCLLHSLLPFFNFHCFPFPLTFSAFSLPFPPPLSLSLYSPILSLSLSLFLSLCINLSLCHFSAATHMTVFFLQFVPLRAMPKAHNNQCGQRCLPTDNVQSR